MLVLSRKLDEQIIIGDQIRITVVSSRGNQVRLGFRSSSECFHLPRRAPSRACSISNQRRFHSWNLSAV